MNKKTKNTAALKKKKKQEHAKLTDHQEKPIFLVLLLLLTKKVILWQTLFGQTKQKQDGWVEQDDEDNQSPFIQKKSTK
jgi:hypothetical protein